MLLPPLLVIWRNIRPLVQIALILAYISHRFFDWSALQSWNISILHLVLDALQQLQYHAMQQLEPFDSYPLIFHVLQQAVHWIWVLMLDGLGVALLVAMYKTWYKVTTTTPSELRKSATLGLFDWAQYNIGPVRNSMIKMRKDVRKDLESSMRKNDPERKVFKTMPVKPRSKQELIKEMKSKADIENKRWQDGKVSGTVYPSSKEHTALMNEAYAAFSWSNPLHAGVWPSVAQYEAEVVAMTGSLFGQNIVGALTSGGTESIVLAIRAHAQYYGKRRGIETGEVICCSTAHAAVNKACELMKLRQVVITSDSDYVLDPIQVAKRITSNTIMIYASAPCFPQGVIDPIEQLSTIAKRYDIGLHVDCCLGGFILPFCQKLGYNVPKFDFSCPGVTSMSADTHKYGYASKGTSVVLYRNEDLRRAQYFSYFEWTGGMYVTPTMAGSRPGGLSACAWASIMSMGQEGYTECAKKIVQATRTIAKAVESIDGLQLLTHQEPTMVVCFGTTSSHDEIYLINDAMTERGWELNALQHPASIHVCVTLNMVNAVDDLLQDLRQSIAQVHNHDKQQHGAAKGRGSARIYGMAESLPSGPAGEVLRCYTDMVLTP